MSCAGLMGLAIAASQTEPGRAADRAGARCCAGRRPGVSSALRSRARMPAVPGNQSDIYYLWSLERVCVALGLRSLDGFDWYAPAPQILLDRQETRRRMAPRPLGQAAEHCTRLALPAKGQPRVRDRPRAALARAEDRAGTGRTPPSPNRSRRLKPRQTRSAIRRQHDADSNAPPVPTSSRWSSPAPASSRFRASRFSSR